MPIKTLNLQTKWTKTTRKTFEENIRRGRNESAVALIVKIDDDDDDDDDDILTDIITNLLV